MFWRRKQKSLNEILRENIVVVIPICALVYGYGQLSQQVANLTDGQERLERILLENK